MQFCENWQCNKVLDAGDPKVTDKGHTYCSHTCKVIEEFYQKQQELTLEGGSLNRDRFEGDKQLLLRI